MSVGKKIAQASVGVSIIMLLGHMLSFVKEALIAQYYGVSYIVDAYTIAIQIPVLLFSFISVAVQSVVIPFYSDIYYNEGKEAAKKYINHLLTFLAVLTIGLTIIGEISAGGLVYLFAPGFDHETHVLAVELLRICFPTIILSVISQVLVAVLNVHKQFVLPSFAVYLMNLGILFFIIFLHSQLGIHSACYGQVIGDAFRMLFLVILSHHFYRYRFSFDRKDKSVIRTLKLSIPVLWSISVAEVNAIVNRMVGSFLFVGSISALTYATKINTVLMQLFVSAIATIVYPMFAESSAKGNMEQLNRRINLTFSAYAMFITPLMCGIFVFRKELIEVAFARGVFDSNAVSLTKSLLGIYTIGMLFMALRSTITNIYYSLKDTKTPAINATIGAVLNIVLNLTLPIFWGVQGIAIATSLTAIFISSRLIQLLVKKHEEVKLNYFYKNFLGIAFASMVVLVSTYIIRMQFSSLSPIWLLLLGSVVGCIIYFLMLFLTNVPIGRTIMNTLISKK